MKPRFLLTALIACTISMSALSAPSAPLADIDVVTTSDGKVNNYCMGGGDDRKLIPFDGIIRNPFRETTHFGCESEGGRPTFMPDLDPAIKDGKLV